jgi:hypothetical protein
MKKTLVTVLAAAAVTACLLSGCGSGEKTGSNSSQAKKVPTETDVYEASLDGFDVSLNLPAPSDATIKAINSYVLKMARVSGKSAEPYTIASYSVKNGSSESTIMDFGFNLTLRDGKKVDGQSAMFFIGDQQDKLPEDKLEESARSGFYDEGVGLYNKLTDLEATEIGPGAVGTAYYVFNTDDLRDIDTVSVTRSGVSREMTKQ